VPLGSLKSMGLSPLDCNKLNPTFDDEGGGMFPLPDDIFKE